MIRKVLCGVAILILCGSCINNNNKNNTFLRIADESLVLGNSEAALNFYNKALEVAPKNMRARVGKVEALINLNKLDMAMFEINQGLQLEKNCEGLLYAKGKVYLLRGNVNKACEIFKHMPTSYKALNALGTIYDAEFNYAMAQEHYKKAIRLNDQYADAYGNLGLSMVLANNDVYGGIEYLERANALPGGSRTQKNNLALAYGIAGEYDKALSIYEETMTPYEAAMKVKQLRRLVQNKNKQKVPQ